MLPFNVQQIMGILQNVRICAVHDRIASVTNANQSVFSDYNYCVSTTSI